MNFLKNIFGKSKELKKFLDEGAVIIDVRNPQEFSSGHIKGSKNIPLGMLLNSVEEIKKLGKPVVTVCQSGMRSGSAKSLLQGKGIKVINGGSWSGLKKLLP
jgi:rhodanese-related sulfurtransferase